MSKATGEQPAAPIFIVGRKAVTPCGPTVAANFKQLLIDYINRRFGQGPRRGTRGGGIMDVTGFSPGISRPFEDAQQEALRQESEFDFSR
jgi:hypothetical protein